jgi:hypothetical protein
MTRKSITKLLKLVCKHSKSMREPFRNSSWTNEKPSLIRNKTGDKFRSKIIKLSVGKTWSSVEKVTDVLKKKFIFYFG